METDELIIFLSIVLPMIPVIFAMRDKYSKRFMIFMIIGFSICLVSAQINTLLINKLNMDNLDYSVTFSPILE